MEIDKYIPIAAVFILELFSILFLKKEFFSLTFRGIIKAVISLLREVTNKKGKDESVNWEKACFIFVIISLVVSVLFIVTDISAFETGNKLYNKFIIIALIHVIVIIAILTMKLNKLFISR